ncbi:MAG: hydantoinase B/oxoprolinase family protein [Gammaproteobacteria bacterium]|nr:hydantoinase B/oxoprolinase family protein [Gammaproteobacteria bacterium]
MNSIELTLFSSRVTAICEEMGAVLQRAALSPNIRDRLDYSCALFDPKGELLAQAAHIPVHLGSMAYAMADLVQGRVWQQGEMVVVNDPYLGGTHLPDVTLIAPLCTATGVQGFVVNRAHHANIGCAAPGSMPLSTTLQEEGVVIPPTAVVVDGEIVRSRFEPLVAAVGGNDFTGDFSAQMAANQRGLTRLQQLLLRMGEESYHQAVVALNDYSETVARKALQQIPPGRYRARDTLDSDGAGNYDLQLEVTLTVTADGAVAADFSGSTSQTRGNVNCPLQVTAAALYYLLRTLMPAETPACAGTFRPVTIVAEEGSLLNARSPAAVVAGNVETSSRVVDLIAAALAALLPQQIPAASHGSMNNIAMGSRDDELGWDYYETMGGGMGAGANGGGLDGVQTHMTNTLNTPIEVVESHYPLRIRRYALRQGSGGSGARRGGEGLEREYEFLRPTQVTLITERRHHRPWGICGGGDGLPGENRLNGTPLPAKVSLHVAKGDRLTLRSAGGGGYGAEDD